MVDMSGTSIQSNSETGVIRIENGVPLNLFEGARTTATGEITIPSRRIALADFASRATVDVILNVVSPPDPEETLLAAELLATGQPLDPRDLFFSPKGEAYAIRNLYPFKNLLNGEHQDQPMPTGQKLAKLAIRIAWDDDGPLLDAIENSGEKALQKFVGQDKERIKTLLERPNDAAYVDTRAVRQPIMLRVGTDIALAVPDRESWVLQQGYTAVATYEHFGIVGGDAYYDKLTPGAPDVSNVVGGTLLVPHNLETLANTQLVFILPEAVRELSGPSLQ